MYQHEWFDRKAYEADKDSKTAVPNFKSQVDKGNIDRVMLSNWQEHCLECAPPLCYTTCPLYLERKDMKCRNVFYGINRNEQFSGLYGFGADLRFRKWGKLESELTNVNLTTEQANKADTLYNTSLGVISGIANALSFIDKKRKANGALNLYTLKMLRNAKDTGNAYDDFVLECYSYEQTPFRLLIESTGKDSHYRTSTTITPGHNFVRIPVKDFKYSDGRPSGKLTVYPENDLEVRLVFTWLDFVKYKTPPPAPKPDADAKPADKIKCIAWDLDNTVWKGVFIESKPEELVINEEAKELMRQLDERGVLQTIISKNTHDDVWPFIESLGLQHFFLYPAINWGQKSESLKKIAGLLNINIDTFGVIDDSPFERQEIQSALPQVRVYKDTEISSILSYPELNLPVTDESRNRRSFYVTEQQRQEVEQSFSGDYTTFLRNCDMHLTIFTPKEGNEATRCYELMQRTNQLNLSTRRYDKEAFDKIMHDDRFLKYGFECHDKFGAYGIVGCAIIEQGEDAWKIHDFVISCRVAQKMVENAFVTWLANKMEPTGKRYILAEYIKTKKNAPIFAVFNEMNFIQEAPVGDTTMLKLDIVTNKPQNDIISVHEK